MMTWEPVDISPCEDYKLYLVLLEPREVSDDANAADVEEGWRIGDAPDPSGDAGGYEFEGRTRRFAVVGGQRHTDRTIRTPTLA